MFYNYKTKTTHVTLPSPHIDADGNTHMHLHSLWEDEENRQFVVDLGFTQLVEEKPDFNPLTHRLLPLRTKTEGDTSYKIYTAEERPLEHIKRDKCREVKHYSKAQEVCSFTFHEHLVNLTDSLIKGLTTNILSGIESVTWYFDDGATEELDQTALKQFLQAANDHDQQRRECRSQHDQAIMSMECCKEIANYTFTDNWWKPITTAQGDTA